MNVSRALKQIYLGGYRLRAYIIFRNRNVLIGEKDGHPRLRQIFLREFWKLFSPRSQCQYVLRKSAQMRGIAIVKGCTRGKEVHT